MRLLLSLFLTAAFLTASHLPIRVFTTAQGLPRNAVNCMVPGSTGLLWFCTSEGLARFDGLQFRVFGQEEGLPSRVIRDLVPSKRGGYWVVTGAGICRLANDARIGEPCRVLPVTGAVPDFKTVFETANSGTFAATARDLFQLSVDEQRFEATSMRLSAHRHIVTVAEGGAGTLLVSTETALFSWKPHEGVHNLSESVVPLGVQSILPLSVNQYLMAATNGLYRMVLNGQNASIEKLPWEGNRVLNALLRRRDGSLWVASVDGVARLSVDARGIIRRAEHFGTDDGIPSNSVSSLVEDSQNNLWGASDGSGIFRIADSGIVSYSGRDGLGNERIAAIFEDLRGRLIVQTSWGSGPNLRLKQNGRFQELPIRHPGIRFFGWGWNQFVQAVHDGSWWVPTSEGLLKFPVVRDAEDLANTTPVLLGPKSELGCSDVFRVFEDSAHSIWVSCMDPRRLTRWDGVSGSFHHFTASEGMPDDSIVMSIRESPDKTQHWLALVDAAVRFENSRFEVFPLVPAGGHAVTRDLLIDHAGRVWVASARAGVFRCDNPHDAHPTFRAYTMKEGLATNVVNSLVEDRAGFIYAGTVLGVDRIDPGAPVDSRRIRHFTAADGLPDSEQNTAFRDSRGHLWFGTLHGLAEFDPEKTRRPLPPEVYLMRVRVRGEDIPLPWEGTRNVELKFAPDRNQVEIEYAAVDLRWAQSMRYQYRLAGADKDWGKPVDQRTVNYASLASGTYRFEVRAVDSDGQVSTKLAGFDFTIEVPLWRRWWFLGSLSILTLAVGAKVYDYRVRNLLALERLRTRIATDLHDDIGASLTQISVLSELARRDSAPHVMADIADLARAMVQDMSDIVWAVKPGHDKFESLVHRMRRFAGDTLSEMELEFQAGSLPAEFSVPLDARRPLYLVFKEAVNNVARHSKASRVWITLDLDGGALVLTVRDNGQGFRVQGQHAGEGLPSIARRMTHLGGSAIWDSPADGGTSFTAILPMRGRPYLPELMGRFRKGGH